MGESVKRVGAQGQIREARSQSVRLGEDTPPSGTVGLVSATSLQDEHAGGYDYPLNVSASAMPEAPGWLATLQSFSLSLFLLSSLSAGTALSLFHAVQGITPDAS